MLRSLFGAKRDQNFEGQKYKVKKFILHSSLLEVISKLLTWIGSIAKWEMAGVSSGFSQVRGHP